MPDNTDDVCFMPLPININDLLHGKTWEDEIASNPAGYAQGLLLLSRHLGLDLRSLQEDSTPLRLRDFGNCKFKKRADVTEDELLKGTKRGRN